MPPAPLLDLYSRMVVGWTMSASNNTQLVCDALRMAIEHRAPQAGLLHHLDQDMTYTSTRYREFMKENGINVSISRIVNCHDNAVAESFFANLKNELTYYRDFNTRQEARTAIFDYIVLFYNRKRPH